MGQKKLTRNSLRRANREESQGLGHRRRCLLALTTTHADVNRSAVLWIINFHWQTHSHSVSVLHLLKYSIMADCISKMYSMLIIEGLCVTIGDQGKQRWLLNALRNAKNTGVTGIYCLCGFPGIRSTFWQCKKTDLSSVASSFYLHSLWQTAKVKPELYRLWLSDLDQLLSLPGLQFHVQSDVDVLG